MPFGQMRTEFVEGAGAMVEGKVVEGTVVEGTVVDGTTVVDGNIVLDGEMLGAGPTTLLPELALSPRPGAGPTVLPNWLGGVPVMLGVGVTPNGEVVTAPGVVGEVVATPGVVVTAPGAVATPPGAPTWASAGNAARVAASRSGKRSGISMGSLLCNQGRVGTTTQASFRPRIAGFDAKPLKTHGAVGIYLFRCRLSH